MALQIFCSEQDMMRRGGYHCYSASDTDDDEENGDECIIEKWWKWMA